MTINFHDDANRKSYTTRSADMSWIEMMRKLIEKPVNSAVDIGCGGGIYAKAFAEMGIHSIIGVDFSKAMIEGAKENCKRYEKFVFMLEMH